MGAKIIRVSEVMPENSKDLEILNYARAHNMVVITHDLDFSMLLAVRGFRKPSVINLRLGNVYPKFVAKRIAEVLSQLEKELSGGIVMSVDEISARYRTLPMEIE